MNGHEKQKEQSRQMIENGMQETPENYAKIVSAAILKFISPVNKNQ
ncbi:MAG: hypothetical protein J6A77_08525 [Lachnospiraceae bacterium]|nr:hypothetical protein [Lachnospiraceae bacterium]